MAAEKIGVLRWTAKAWARAKYLMRLADDSRDEILLFGLAAEDDAGLLVDVLVPRQEVSGASADVDENDLSAMMSELAEQGIEPRRWLRYWIHTHVGKGKPTPSHTDWGTLDENFRECSWQAMILMPSQADVPSDGRCVVRFNEFVGATVEAQMQMCDYALAEEEADELDDLFLERVRWAMPCTRDAAFGGYEAWAAECYGADRGEKKREGLAKLALLGHPIHDRGEEYVARAHTRDGQTYLMTQEALDDYYGLEDIQDEATVLEIDGNTVSDGLDESDKVADKVDV